MATRRPAAGYSIRTTRPENEVDRRELAHLLNVAFGRDFHNAEELRVFTAHAPCFDPEMDLVVEAPDGTLAAYVGVSYDDINRRGIFEPVCTHPDHRGKGLARGLMLEGLRRLRQRGARTATVGTGDADPANRLYEAVGFDEVYRGRVWLKSLPAG